MAAPRIAIIGGGLTGLATGYHLAKNDVDVTIFEKGDQLGGLAAGFTLAGHQVEQAYHFLYKTDEYILALLEELGLTDRLTFHPSSVSTYYGDKLYPMKTPFDLLRFTPLNFVDRIRAGVSVLYLQQVKNWRALSTTTAIDWLRKWAGRSVADVIWEPLLRGKFDRYYDKVTMSWLWGRVKQRVDSRDRDVGGEALGYIDGGFKILVDKLVETLNQKNAAIRMQANIEKITRTPNVDGVSVIVDGETQYFDRVLVTTPSHVAAGLLSDYDTEDNEYFKKARSIDYLDAVVHVFATPQKITDFYWHNINTPNAPFVVFLSLTELVGAERFDGLNIYYIGDYVPREHRYMTQEGEDLKEEWYREIGKMFPHFDRSSIVDDGIFKMRNAQHIVDIGFETDKLLDHQTPCPGVYMCNFSQIFPMDRGTNYAVRDGKRMADLLLKGLDRTKPVDQPASVHAA